jgi:alpha-D-xyloside xylohydrolase
VDVLAMFTKLKCSLMPYLYNAACQAHEDGTPMMRGMILEFPDDPGCDYLDLQYMLGDSLLVAPVFSYDNIVNYYVPAGRWTSLLNGKVVEGPRWVREEHDFMSLPLMVRPNSIIAVGNHNDRPDYDYAEGVTLRVYELEDGKQISAEIPSVTGEIQTTFEVSRAGRMINVKRRGKSKPWQLLLVGIATIASVTGGTVESTSPGALVTPIPKTDHLQIILS